MHSKQQTTRRRFMGQTLGTVAAANVSSWFSAEPAPAAEVRPAAASGKRLLLSQLGGDRATGYVMSNKIARRDGNLLCTWLDVERQNQWAVVDPVRGEIVRTGAVGERRVDNHCGAAIATDTDGTLHLLIGAHHGAFVYYRMLPDKQEWEPVEDGRAVGKSATYPSLICDGSGTLHVTYRLETKGRDPQLHYCRRPKGGKWSEPRALVRMAVSEHSWLTNAIEVGESGRLHVVFSNTLPVPGQGADARYFGASHLYSDDSGLTWRQFGDAEPLTLPADARGLKRIESPAMPPERIEAHYSQSGALALTSYYHKMALSNPVVDQRGRPWVVLHNILTGDALLYRCEDERRWVAIPLRESVQALLPGYRIRHCGQLSRHRVGTIEVVLMVSPEAEVAWGATGTTLVRLVVDADGRITHQEMVCPPEPGVPNWLPSLERWYPHAPIERPALLYTRGINAGGGAKNINDVKTEVWLQLPTVGS